MYASNSDVKAMLESGDVIVNLTQNCDFMNYSSNFCPCLLTKSMMWSLLKENRPMLWQEQFNAQGVPIFEHTMAAAGVPDSQIQLDLGHSNMVRLAGNGFHIACAGSFVGYVLSILEPNEG